MVSGPVETEGVFCWTNFLAKITKMARTRDMFALYVVLQPLSVLVGVFTVQTHPFSKFSSSHFRRYQLLKMTWKIIFLSSLSIYQVRRTVSEDKTIQYTKHPTLPTPTRRNRSVRLT